MKKSIVLLGLFLFTLNLSAQNNSVKITENGILFPKLGLGYERAINDNYTAGITLGGIIPRSFSLNSDELGSDATLKVSGFNTILDFRKYTDSAFDGFFLASHVKGSRYSFDYLERDLSGGYEFGMSFSTVGLGFNLGWSAILFDVVTLDVIAFGLGYDFHILDAYVDNAEISQADIDAFTNSLSEVPIIGKRFEFNETGDGYELDSVFGLPSFRFGFSLGYAF